MMAKRGGVAHRPIKSGEFTIVFGSSETEKGWADLRATQGNALADAWDFLTRTPLERQAGNHPLRDVLATVTRGGRVHEQWQHKLSGGARLWFYVDGHTVVLVRCHTRHPNETK